MIHYQTKNWLGIIFRVHGTVIPRIFLRVLLIAGVALGLCYLVLERGVDLPTSGTLHALVGVALGLLLVFRTNASYDRFWEGRKLVGGMVNNCRDLARQSAVYLAESEPEVRDQVRRYVIALYGTIRHYLREERDFSDLEELLSEEQRAELERATAPPLLVARWLTDVFAVETRAGRMTEFQQSFVEQDIGDMIDLWGGAERILRTPVPFAYAHHIKGFLTIFCLTSPIALIGPMGWYAPLAAAVVAYGLYGIDEIGVEIEDPFGYDPNDLDLDGIGETIARNVSETLSQ